MISGLICAVLSSLEGRVGFVDLICSFWGNGCSEAANVTLIHLPVAVWGIAYYIALALAAFVLPRWSFYLVMAGAGVEAALIIILVNMEWNCLFCLINGVVMLSLVLLVFDFKRIWETLAIASILFIAANHMLLVDTVRMTTETQSLNEDIIVAQVGDNVIYQSELDEPLSKQIYRLEGLKYQLRKNQLKPLISERLLSLEAGFKGMLPEVYQEQLLEEASRITEEELNNYLSNNPSVRVNWKGTEEALRENIRNYLVEEKRKVALENAAKGLVEKYPIKVLLVPPSMTVSSITIKQGTSPSIGPHDAPVVVFEFSDYQCPTCRRTHKTSLDLRKKYNGKIRWVFKDFPLNQHKESILMAQAARCAAEQGKFWEYQDFLYTSEEHPGMDTLKGYAKKLNLDMNQFSKSLESEKYKAIIEKEKEDSKLAGISRTPTFVINGRMTPGKISYNELVELIEHELHKKGVAP